MIVLPAQGNSTADIAIRRTDRNSICGSLLIVQPFLVYRIREPDTRNKDKIVQNPPRRCRWRTSAAVQVGLRVGCLVLALAAQRTFGQDGAASGRLVFPLDRTAYFIGEAVPMAVVAPAGDRVRLEAVHHDGRTLLYHGPPGTIAVSTARLAPGTYRLELNGRTTPRPLILTSTLRRSAGSLQDEFLPAEQPRMTGAERKDAAAAAARIKAYRRGVVTTLKETELSACITMAAAGMGRRGMLDELAEAGTMLLANADTRPTSFFPVHVDPAEIDGMSQRMLLTAQANGRYPNFAGFCFGWDTTGFGENARKGLLVYWGWGDKADALRKYVARQQKLKEAELTRRTGLRGVSQAEYIAYLLSIGRPEFAPMIDLPTKLWLEEIVREVKPLGRTRRAELEKRLDAWSGYLMSLYDHAYSRYAANLRAADPTLRHTASVQVDHCAVIDGQYLPAAYRSLDLHYQSTWNDQVGGPDYAYQWLFTQGLLNIHRGGKPTWISSALGSVHGRSAVPGKLVRVAAHGLAHGASGIGFAHEAFSNVLGGMNRRSCWDNIRHTDTGAGLLAARDFIHRFACLATNARGDHGVGILYSRSQYARQCVVMGFGKAPHTALVALTRLGYTPRFVTEEEIARRGVRGVRALVVVGQTFALPTDVLAGIRTFADKGGVVLVDGSTTVDIPGAKKLAWAHPLTRPGKPHSWSSPNVPKGLNDTLLYERWHAAAAAVFAAALRETAAGVFVPAAGHKTKTTLMQIDGGRDAKYVVAVNDSHIRTQADWHQLKERLLPPAAADSSAELYDVTAEKPLGKVAPLVCDLSMTTARVYAVLPRKLAAIAPAATQAVRAGDDLVVRVAFHDDAGEPLRAVLPFHLAIHRPDGKTHQDFYRGTDASGTFAMTIPLPVNAPAGTWTVAVRSQLTGDVASLPVTVRGPRPAPLADRMDEQAIVRGREAIERMLVKGAKLVLPLFDTEHFAKLLPVAREVEKVLAARGVGVEIRRKPEWATYTLSYAPTPAEMAANARIDRGERIGRVKRNTVNHNDWYGGESGYQFGRPLVLLDLAGEKDNEMAESLDRRGMLWPEVTAAFPGRGRAVVQVAHWAFAPRTPALVIQAADVEGLLAGGGALAKLPGDRFTPGIRRARAALLRQYHIGGRPASPPTANLTAAGLTTRRQPRPFVIAFRDSRPLPADQVQRPQPHVHKPHALPVALEPNQFIPYAVEAGKYVETSTAGSLLHDTRFWQALLVPVEVDKAGEVTVVADGIFRYSDRKPRSQAQWENILALREKLIKLRRRPMSIEVRLAGRPIAHLTPAKTATRDVPIETLPFYAKEKPRSVREEVVVELRARVRLAAGRSDLLLIHHNIVDGQLRKLRIGR